MVMGEGGAGRGQAGAYSKKRGAAWPKPCRTLASHQRREAGRLPGEAMLAPVFKDKQEFAMLSRSWDVTFFLCFF